ncbi:MAG: hypothetical protein U0350_38075 [Caldilineaceae bacterium]
MESKNKARSVHSNTGRINVALPADLLQEFRELVPARQRNQFIVDLVERELRRQRFAKAWAEAAGAWSDEDHPDLMTAEDIDRFVRKLRETSRPRSWDEILAESEKALIEEHDQLPARHEHSDPAVA